MSCIFGGIILLAEMTSISPYPKSQSKSMAAGYMVDFAKQHFPENQICSTFRMEFYQLVYYCIYRFVLLGRVSFSSNTTSSNRRLQPLRIHEELK
jgi:hypothetical protein